MCLACSKCGNEVAKVKKVRNQLQWDSYNYTPTWNFSSLEVVRDLILLISFLISLNLHQLIQQGHFALVVAIWGGLPQNQLSCFSSSCNTVFAIAPMGIFPFFFWTYLLCFSSVFTKNKTQHTISGVLFPAYSSCFPSTEEPCIWNCLLFSKSISMSCHLTLTI